MAPGDKEKETTSENSLTSYLLQLGLARHVIPNQSDQDLYPFYLRRKYHAHDASRREALRTRIDILLTAVFSFILLKIEAPLVDTETQTLVSAAIFLLGSIISVNQARRTNQAFNRAWEEFTEREI